MSKPVVQSLKFNSSEKPKYYWVQLDEQMTPDTFHRSAFAWILVNEKVPEVIKVDSKMAHVLNCKKYECVSINNVNVDAKP